MFLLWMLKPGRIERSSVVVWKPLLQQSQLPATINTDATTITTATTERGEDIKTSSKVATNSAHGGGNVELMKQH